MAPQMGADEHHMIFEPLEMIEQFAAQQIESS